MRGRSELCRRCGSELSLLYEIEEQAGNLKEAAVRAWAAGELQTAVKLARRSLGLKDEADVRIILRFLSSQVDESGQQIGPARGPAPTIKNSQHSAAPINEW